MSSKCYQYFVEAFKLPIWISSFSLVMSVIYYRFYTSKLASLKLKIDESENNYKRYYDHIDRVKDLGDNYLIKATFLSQYFESIIFDNTKFYDEFYRNNSPHKKVEYSPSSHGDSMVSIDKSVSTRLFIIKNELKNYREQCYQKDLSQKQKNQNFQIYTDAIVRYANSMVSSMYLVLGEQKQERMSYVQIEELSTEGIFFVENMFIMCGLDRDDELFYKLRKDTKKVFTDEFIFHSEIQNR